GRQEDALPDLEEAMRLAETTGQLAILCHVLQIAAGVYLGRGEVERQRAYSAKAVGWAERIGDPVVLAVMLGICGADAFFCGDWPQTRADCERALAVCRGDHVELSQNTAGVPRLNPAHEMLPRLYLGQLCLVEGDLHEAVQHLEAAQAIVTTDFYDVVLVQV